MPKRDYPWYITAPAETPYTFDWWIGLSARAFWLWSRGDMPTERWARLDHFINARAYRCLDNQGTCERCGGRQRYTSMVRLQGKLYCPACIVVVYSATRKARVGV